MSIDATGTSAAPTNDLPTGVSFWRLLGTVGTTVGSTSSPVWEVKVGARTAASDTSWGAMVDVNGDGYEDVLVASAISSPPSSPPNAVGYVRAFLGGPSGLASTPATTLTDPTGANTGFGGIAAAGDVNGDGFADVVVSADATNNDQGRIYVFYGSASGLSTIPSATIDGPDGTETFFGEEISGAGDVNGDGYADVVVGTGTVVAHVYLGSPTGLSASPARTLNSPAAGVGFGNSVAGVGDINGDGFGDLVIGASGANSNVGGAYLYLGSTTGIATEPSATISPPPGAWVFGTQVVAAGDVNGDGLADVLIASQGTVGSGGPVATAYVFLGGTGGLATAPQASIVVGGIIPTVSSAGDMNGAGFAAIVVTNYQASTQTGTASIYVGGLTGIRPTAFVTLVGPSGPGSQFGRAVTTGDVNGDGFSDLIIGAPALTPGDVYLYPGSTGAFATSPGTTIAGPSTDTGFGGTLE
jgi:hypothetical protein